MDNKDYYKQFDVRFGSLTIGTHYQDLKVNKVFFEKYENEQVIDADVAIKLEIERKEKMVILLFHMKGTLTTLCDLCLEEMKLLVSKTEKLILKLVDVAHKSDDTDIEFVSEQETTFNVEQYVYEYLMTTFPIRKQHSGIDGDVCNPLMLDLIEQAKYKSEESHESDSRWDALKGIRFEE